MKIKEFLQFMLENRRLIYHFFSGLMFLVLSVVLFFWCPGLKKFFNVRLFGLLLFIYSLYRLSVFAWLLRKELKKDT